MANLIYRVDVYGSTNKISRSFEKTFASDEVAKNWGKNEEVLLGFKVSMKFLREEEGAKVYERIKAPSISIMESDAQFQLSSSEITSNSSTSTTLNEPTIFEAPIQDTPKRGRPPKSGNKK